LSAFVVVARWIARPGQEEAVREAVRQLVTPSRAEPGNLMYEVNEDPEDPRVFVFYEQYADEDAYAAHGSSEHFRRLATNGAIPRLETRERWFLRTLPAASA
jgi:quinol monooxygenase YgiN